MNNEKYLLFEVVIYPQPNGRSLDGRLAILHHGLPFESEQKLERFIDAEYTRNNDLIVFHSINNNSYEYSRYIKNNEDN